MTQLSLLNLRNHADVNNPEMLLEVALSRIVAHYSTIQSALVYRPTHEGIVVWHAENSLHDLGAFIPFEAESRHQQVITGQNATTSKDTMAFIAPLLHKGRVFALAEFVASVPLGQEIEQLAELAEELALLLYNQLTNYLLQQQLTFTGKLTVSSSFRDLAALIGSTFLSVGQFISINQLLYSDEVMTGGRVVATANRTEGFSQDLMLELEIHSFGQLYDLLTQDGEVLLNDIPSDERLTDAERGWLQSQQIKSLYILPLWIHNRLDAFIAIADTSRALAPSDLERNLLHNIIHQAAIIIEKQQLLDQSQQSVRQSAEQVHTLRLINELITSADNNQLDKPLLQKTAEILLEVTSADHIGIVMGENGQGYLVSEAPATDMIGIQIDTGEFSLYPLMRQHQKPVTILDVANSEQLETQTRERFIQAGIKSLMVLPMFDENNTLIGSVGLDFYTQQSSIDDSTVEAASAVVSQVALRLQKVNLLADSQRKAEQLEKLTEFGQQLRAYLSTEEILNTTLSIAPKAIDVDYIGVLLYDRATNAIRNTATRFHDDVTIDLDATIINEETNSIALEAWTTHELVQADDLHLDWSWKHNLHRELQSIIAMPLTLAGVTLGVLEVGSVNPNHFDTQNVTTIRQISNQLAIALSNASAYAQSQRLAHNKSRANDIIAQLQQQLEVRDILNVTVNEIGKTLGAKKARIRLGTPPKTMRDE